MKRGLVTRRIATAILMFFACLILLAIAPMVFGVKLDDAMRKGAGLFLSHADTFLIDRPARLSTMPNIIVSSGTLIVSNSSEGRRPAIKLQSPTIDIVLAEDAFTTRGTSLNGPPSVEDVLLQAQRPLASAFAIADLEKLNLQNATVILRWREGGNLTLESVDAEITVKSKSAYSAVGHFTYLGQKLAFEASSQLPTTGPEPTSASMTADGQRGRSWPLRVTVHAPFFKVTTDGTLEIGDSWKYRAQTEVWTADTIKLANWLGYVWQGEGSGPAFGIKGIAGWDRGVVSFGKSQISLADQNGIGAVAVSYRDGRPLIEATAAFAALDVAPLLLRRPPPTIATALPSALLPVGEPAWRALATAFPAAAKMDADWRLSVGRMQWRGEPIGKAAFSVSARQGLVHADFSELELGSLAGNLQIAIDQTALRHSPVTMRGKFTTANLADIGLSIFNMAVVSGRGQAQFEILGQGATLGDVIDRASGRGSVDGRDGQVHFDLATAQKLQVGAIAGGRIAGLPAIASETAYQQLAIKFQWRDGSLFFDDAMVKAGDLVATANGRLGLLTSDLDVKLRINAATGDLRSVSQSVTKASTMMERAASRSVGDQLSIIGPWAQPTISVVPMGSVP